MSVVNFIVVIEYSHKFQYQASSILIVVKSPAYVQIIVRDRVSDRYFLKFELSFHSHSDRDEINSITTMSISCDLNTQWCSYAGEYDVI